MSQFEMKVRVSRVVTVHVTESTMVEAMPKAIASALSQAKSDGGRRDEAAAEDWEAEVVEARKT